MRRIGKLAGDLFDMLTRYAGDLLRPCRGIGFDLGEILRRIDIVKPAIQTVVGQNQVIGADRGPFSPLASVSCLAGSG